MKTMLVCLRPLWLGVIILTAALNSAYAFHEERLPESPAPLISAEMAPALSDSQTTPWQGERSYGFLSRGSLGVDVSPLGIGMKGAVILGPLIDGRIDANIFVLNPGPWKVNGFDVNPNFHLMSAAAKVDFYPFNSMWRLSPGMMFVNQNRFSATGSVAGGTSFAINGVTYYSARENPATGAVPVNGIMGLGFNRQVPAFTASGGFGRFVPHSRRRWSFPSEFGVIFTGAPTVDVNVKGWVCKDYQQTQCSDLGNPANPVAVQFNNNLHTALARWRRNVGVVSVYPIFSYSVTYSFGIR